jgi:hypothetical protein
MSDPISIEQLNKIKNYYIISRQRSGSTLLGSILNNHEDVNVIFEENTYYLLKGKYKNSVFDSDDIIDAFVEDFFMLIFLKINILQLPPKNELKIILKKYRNLKLNYRQFTNLFYLQFYPYVDFKKDIKFIINKEVSYHNLLHKFYKDNPDTKFIFLIRNCLSNTGKYIRGAGKKKIVSVALKWKLNCHYYINSGIPKDHYKIITFEDLIADREKIVMEVCEFLKIPFLHSMLNFQDHIDDALKKIDEIHHLHPDFLEFFNKMHGSTFSKKTLPNRAEEIKLNNKELAKINLICHKERAFFGYPVSEVKWQHYFYFNPYDLYLIIRTIFYNFLSNTYFKLPTQFRFFLRSINKNYWLNKNSKYDGIHHLPKKENLK